MPFTLKTAVRLAGVLMFAALVVVACGDDDDSDAGQAATTVTSSPTNPATDDATATEADTDSMSPTMGDMMASPSMDQGMDDSGAMDADPDLLFIDGMIVHHASVIAMAEVAQEAGEHEEIKQLADEIIEAQQQEIEQLEQWRDEWYPDAPESDLSGMMDVAGMDMSDADMQMLREAEDFDKMFIDMMIEHHQSAIEMAQQIQETTERPELQQLADDIITAQQAEIDQMREWREEWYGAS